MERDSDIVYDVDDLGTIVFVNEEWDRFAAANAGAAAASTVVLNRPLLDFVADANVREIYSQLLRRVRAGPALTFRFRCDSPGCRRLLQMEIERRQDGGVRFRTHTLALEARTPLPLDDQGRAPRDEFVRVCSWCKKICVGDSWEDAEVAVERMELLERSVPPSLTHGICEPCHAALLASVGSADSEPV
jgi:hypothetical protein